MLGFAPIASVPLSALPGLNLYPYTLTNSSYLYDLSVGISPVTIDVLTVESTSQVYNIVAGLGLINIYPDPVVNQNNVYGVVTFVFDKAATVFKTNIVVTQQPYNVVVNSITDKFIKINAFILN